ncbi:hypothetical protein M408DRAFT_329722 [Serendipita vermifera MAFF 305830]|uniref:Uncharacterized protein n=1 Tax=Serendipita vermifera MAFF 305830 TaxID=933852 RepID=A0A0C2WPB8_SERVB|nr:hypothetical protein M408DRAFT_329722 [Serendipita vermifera MAFF 305830]
MLSEPVAALETPQGKRLRNNLTLAVQSLVQTLDRGVLVDDPDNTRTAALVALARMAQIPAFRDAVTAAMEQVAQVLDDDLGVERARQPYPARLNPAKRVEAAATLYQALQGHFYVPPEEPAPVSSQEPAPVSPAEPAPISSDEPDPRSASEALEEID